VSWFKKRKKKGYYVEYETVVNDVPVSTLIRWFLYDTDLMEPNKVASLVGLNPVSDEGDEKEIEESADRLEEMTELMPYIAAMAEISASVLTAIQLEDIAEDRPEAAEELKEDMESMISMYKFVAIATLVSAFSSALKLGLITKEVISADFKDMEDFDEQ